MKEVRVHGRGGQGSVTMAQMLTQAAFEGGKWAQGFPSFGVERRGAPVKAFARIDDERITDRSHIYNPHYVIVQDPTLLGLIDVVKGLREGGMVLINTEAGPEEVDLDTEEAVETVDATSIALDHLGAPIMNTALLGAFSGATGIIDRENLNRVVRRKFDGEVGENNVGAINAAFEEVK